MFCFGGCPFIIFPFRIEVFGFIFSSLNKFLLIPIELLLLNKVIIASLILKFILTVLLDVTFLSDFSFSLKLGVNGVGFSNIITEGANTILLAIFIIRNIKSTTIAQVQIFYENTFIGFRLSYKL